jgi:hypothetical protein
MTNSPEEASMHTQHMRFIMRLIEEKGNKELQAQKAHLNEKHMYEKMQIYKRQTQNQNDHIKHLSRQIRRLEHDVDSYREKYQKSKDKVKLLKQQLIEIQEETQNNSHDDQQEQQQHVIIAHDNLIIDHDNEEKQDNNIISEPRQ